MAQGDTNEGADSPNRPKRRVLVMGAATLADPVKRGDVEVVFNRPGAAFTDFDAVILPYGYCMRVEKPEREQRTAEFARLLATGGVVCWLLVAVQHERRIQGEQLLDWAANKAPSQALLYPELDHLLKHGGVVPSDPLVPMVAKPVCRRREFTHWTDKYCSANHSLTVVSQEKYAPATVISTDRSGKPLGVAFPVDAGQVAVLPYLPGNRDDQSHINAMTELAVALIDYRDNIMAEPPPWLSEITFGDESRIRAKLDGLAEEQQSLESQLEPFEREKKILYLRDTLLEYRVVDALRARGLRVERDEVDRRIEDFFLLGPDGEQCVIGEVKSAEKNVKSTHIAQLNSHRAQHDLDYDFPGLLLANTFCKAATTKDKDTPIAPRVIRHAVHEHVVVVRTLDLFRLFDQMEKGSVEKGELLDLLTKTPGWLHVTEAGTYSVVTE